MIKKIKYIILFVIIEIAMIVVTPFGEIFIIVEIFVTYFIFTY